MKRSFIKAAAPALAVGLAFSAQAATASASVSTHTETQPLKTVQSQIAVIDKKLEDIHADLARERVISEETRVRSLSRLNSLLYQTNTASQKVDALAQQLGGDTLQTADAETKLNTASARILEVRDALFIPDRDDPANTEDVPEGVMDEN
ncbi:hypothetical protein M3221_01950 [Domibacillus indicus]|uniref:hypothetical protein n=1 Tax=Domibacillus indicus TaxID=1437523 RepID=UPI00203E4970|nr:hypothetical protein [Domibacillus indicus]MCM3787177.1 hypothetical protein [Domibacillus indicus]